MCSSDLLAEALTKKFALFSVGLEVCMLIPRPASMDVCTSSCVRVHVGARGSPRFHSCPPLNILRQGLLLWGPLSPDLHDAGVPRGVSTFTEHLLWVMWMNFILHTAQRAASPQPWEGFATGSSIVIEREGEQL